MLLGVEADGQRKMFRNVALLAVAALIGVSPLVWVILHFNGGLIRHVQRLRSGLDGERITDQR